MSARQPNEWKIENESISRAGRQFIFDGRIGEYRKAPSDKKGTASTYINKISKHQPHSRGVLINTFHRYISREQQHQQRLTRVFMYQICFFIYIS